MDDFATGYLAGQDGGNNNGGFFGNEGLWAVIILAIIFGWGTNGYGRNGGDNGMNSYIPYLVGTGATGQGGADTRAALSEGFYQQDTSRSLAGIQSGICSLGYDQLAQMNTRTRYATRVATSATGTGTFKYLGCFCRSHAGAPASIS